MYKSVDKIAKLFTISFHIFYEKNIFQYLKLLLLSEKIGSKILSQLFRENPISSHNIRQSLIWKKVEPSRKITRDDDGEEETFSENENESFDRE